MKNLITHPKLEKLQKLSDSKQEVIITTGFIGKKIDGLIRLHPTMNLDEYIEIDEKSIIDSEHDESTGLTELYIKMSSTVTFVNRIKVPLVTIVARQAGSSGGASASDDCVEKRIKKCKEDPLNPRPENCEKMKDTFKIICDMFGDPKFANTFKMI